MHTQSDRHERECRGHPFRVSGMFPSIYHQGSVKDAKTELQWTAQAKTMMAHLGSISQKGSKKVFLY